MILDKVKLRVGGGKIDWPPNKLSLPPAEMEFVLKERGSEALYAFMVGSV